MSKGRYIALCEGDDFWTDENKLQKQVDVLEKNSHYSMSFHSVEVSNQIPEVNYSYPIPSKDVLKFRDIVFKHYIPTCSLIFRFSFLPNPLPSWLFKSKIGDIPLELMLADKGDAYFFKENMGCYRRNSSSLTSSQEQIKNGRRIFISVYSNLNRHFNYKYFYLFSFLLVKLRLGYVKDWLKGLSSSNLMER
jgi:hypothetical protein